MHNFESLSEEINQTELWRWLFTSVQRQRLGGSGDVQVDIRIFTFGCEMVHHSHEFVFSAFSNTGDSASEWDLSCGRGGCKFPFKPSETRKGVSSF
ncbi:unnamed protein product [Linum trigynum]|uniref:Uncharacterized protein n=1 Tax=Linum trigynum TaxID=586398 RepID=A0AAV2EHR2_9ROSI